MHCLCISSFFTKPTNPVVLGRGHDRGVDYWGIGILLYEMLTGISPFSDDYDDDQMVVCNNIVKGKVDYKKLSKSIHEVESKGLDPIWNISPSSFYYIPPGGWIPSDIPPPKPPPRKPPSSTPSKPDARASCAESVGHEVSSVEDVIRRLLKKNPVKRLGCLSGGAQDVKTHDFFSCEIEDWAALRRRRYPAPLLPQLASDKDTSRFDMFDPETEWKVYHGDHQWYQGFVDE